MIRTSAHTQFTQFLLGICRIMVLFGFCTAKNVFRFSCLYYYVSLIPRQCGFSTVISFSHTHTSALSLSLSISRSVAIAPLLFSRFSNSPSLFWHLFLSLLILCIHLFKARRRRTNVKPPLFASFVLLYSHAHTDAETHCSLLPRLSLSVCVQENLDREMLVLFFSHNRLLLNRTCVDCWLMSLRVRMCVLLNSLNSSLSFVLERMIR